LGEDPDKRGRGGKKERRTIRSSILLSEEGRGKRVATSATKGNVIVHAGNQCVGVMQGGKEEKERGLVEKESRGKKKRRGSIPPHSLSKGGE